MQAVANSKVLRLQIDTGFNLILIYGNKLNLPTRLDPDARSSDFARSLRARMGLAHELRLGDWSGRQVTVFVTDDEPRDAVFDGLLGPMAIGVRRLGFDFERQIIGLD